jgi:hypothetical protein
MPQVRTDTCPGHIAPGLSVPPTAGSSNTRFEIASAARWRSKYANFRLRGTPAGLRGAHTHPAACRAPGASRERTRIPGSTDPHERTVR